MFKKNMWILSILTILIVGSIFYHQHAVKNNNAAFVQDVQTMSNYSIDEVVDAVYGKNGVNLDLQKILEIKNLVEQLKSLSQVEQQQVACLVINMLQEKKDKHILYCKLVSYLESIADDIVCKDTDTAIMTYAEQLFNYFILEQAEIVDHQKKLYIFLQAQKSFHLPKLMSFWATQDGAKALDAHIGSSTDNVVIQDMMTDMAILIGTQMGAEFANAQIDTQAEDLANILTQQSKTIQANVQSFQSQAQASQVTSLQKQITNFSNKSTEIQNKTQGAIDQSSLELNYLYQNISLNKPLQQYLSSPVVFDQIFAQGDMLTPEGYVWKNPFSVGDWQYAKDDDSFYQCQNSSIMSKDSTGILSSTRAENNSIFTEYSSAQSSYSISGVITIYQIEYPFFVGIIFNKARWISGNYEGLRKARMVGVYGKSETDIGVYFAEQYTMTDEQLASSKSDEPIQQPLAQILSGSVDKKIPLVVDAFNNLKKESIILNFEITTTPEKATFAFWNDKNSKKEITVDKLNSQMFLYHGIGFICPGAIAQFKLNSPKNILFTPDAILKYKG
ncbi:hypothetical protein [Candidatus Chromulinivorax destructor]|uniref:Uncharacterized protein n=1 Tax=Candidatus Chromulinivorax destructor TaxID=2066483 RepID=A0A345ZBZ1_9BACT|nr:hypothetical protein [Candidatus Chromulinivorax destructor]AXK60808.1 hypothetical protein C0J27_03615 [Candidatus Chromulinivorax destructor]